MLLCLQMVRASVILPLDTYQELSITAKQERKPTTALIREFIDYSLAARRKNKLAKMYQELKQLDGTAKSEVTDASTTINEVLYGEHGAWRGTPRKNDKI